MYEGSGGTQGTTLRDTGLPVVIVTNVGASSGKVRKTPVMRVEHDGSYAMVASQGGAPMRDCDFSYWKARDMPVPQRMPPYALIMSDTAAPASTAANMFVLVTR